MDFENIFKLFEQEVETVKRTEAILIKNVFWINCLALTVWATTEMGYVIDYQFPITVAGFLRFIGEQHFALGLTIYLAINFLMQSVSVLLYRLSYKFYGWYFLKFQSGKIASFGIEPVSFEDINFGEVGTEGMNLKRTKEIRERNALHQKNKSEMVVTLALVYDLIVSTRYPNAHHVAGTIFLWLYAILVIWQRGKSGFIVYITDQWREGINKYVKTTSTTTATTTTAPPSRTS